MVALSAAGVAILPFAGETEVAGALAADVVVAEVVVERLWVGEGLVAVDPLAPVAGLFWLLGDNGRDGLLG